MPVDVYKRWLLLVITAAKQGNADAQYRMGVEAARNKDYGRAVDWLTKSATQGNVPAQVFLGRMYFMGTQIPKDYTQALLWTTKAAEAGNADAQAYLGYMYRDGIGVSADRNTAMSWFARAAAQGDKDAANQLRALQRSAESEPERERNVPPALAFRCQLDTVNKSSESQLLTGSDAALADYQKRYKACLRSNWHRLFGDAPFPGD